MSHGIMRRQVWTLSTPLWTGKRPKASLRGDRKTLTPEKNLEEVSLRSCHHCIAGT